MQDPSLIVMLALLAIAWLLSVAMYAHACCVNRRDANISHTRARPRRMPGASVPSPPPPRSLHSLGSLLGEPPKKRSDR